MGLLASVIIMKIPITTMRNPEGEDTMERRILPYLQRGKQRMKSLKSVYQYVYFWGCGDDSGLKHML